MTRWLRTVLAFSLAAPVSLAVVGSASAQDQGPVPSRFGGPTAPSEERFGGAAVPGTVDPAPSADRNDPADARFGTPLERSDVQRDAGPAPERFGFVPSQNDVTSATGADAARFGVEPEADAAYGAYQRGLYATARNLALPRAEQGDAAAQTLLGEIYSRGLGVGVDDAEATRWYKLASAQGVPEAQFRYALALLREDDGSTEARRLMEAAAESGNTLAMFNHAQLVLTDRPGAAGQEAAYEFFLAAARRGVPDAQYAVAQYFAQGTVPVAPDETTARRWLERAARRGFDTAQLEYGAMLLEGIGGDRDLQAGFEWTERAARSGNVAAKAQLAKLYWGGIGVEPDNDEAAGWYVVARRAGLRDVVLEDFWLGLSEEARQRAIERANRLASR